MTTTQIKGSLSSPWKAGPFRCYRVRSSLYQALLSSTLIWWVILDWEWQISSAPSFPLVDKSFKYSARSIKRSRPLLTVWSAALSTSRPVGQSLTLIALLARKSRNCCPGRCPVETLLQQALNPLQQACRGHQRLHLQLLVRKWPLAR